MSPDRRTLLALLAAAALPGAARAQGRAPKDTLNIGLDLSDTQTLDPARQIDYTPPLTLDAVYDTLVTYAPGRYQAVIPKLAAVWERLPDAPAWRFTLWPDASFASGAKVTPDDVAFSINRMLALRDVPAQLLSNLAGASVSGAGTVDITLHDPELPPLGLLAAPAASVLERAAVMANGGSDQPNADGASPWLDQHSAGSGRYVLERWQRRQSIRLAANASAWRQPPAFAHIALRHVPDSTAQQRGIERGELDAAFNLIPEHVDALRGNPAVRVVATTALDFAYLALNADPALNPALAKPEARQAIAYAIDYDDLLQRQLGGKAVRPASFLPLGLLGATDALAPAQDLGRARDMLRRAGQESGFALELLYADSAIAGLSYSTVARNLRRDLGRVGIEVRLRAMAPIALRDAYQGGRAQAVLAFWTEPVVDNLHWAQAALERLGPRLGQADPAPLLELARRAAAAEPEQAAPLWADWQRGMIARANLLPLFQPQYQVAVRSDVSLSLTAAGWLAQLDECRPA